MDPHYSLNTLYICILLNAGLRPTFLVWTKIRSLLENYKAMG